MRTTRPNVISWYNLSPDPGEFPVPFSDCKTGSLVTFPGDTIRFYLNPLTAGQQALPAAVHLVSFTTTATATEAPGYEFTADIVSATEKTFFGSIPVPNVADGYYRFRLTFASGTLYSNLFEVLPPSEARNLSLLCQFRHSKSIQGIRYPWITEGFEQAVRIRANLIDTGALVESSTYREVTTGLVRPYNAAADWTLTFKTPLTDRDILQGISVMLLHDTIRLNGKPVTTKVHLNITPSARSTFSTGEFTVYDNTFANPLVP